jgi:hypothetical protein
MVCTARQPDGGGCTMDDQCAQGHHCLGGFCCNAATGSCCSVASDCPALFSNPPLCDNPDTNCQGHRVDKLCMGNVCGSMNVDDDTACSPAIQLACGAYAPVTCTSAPSQTPLTCPTSCQGDAGCVQPQNHCLGGVCKPWIEDGGLCGAPADCRSGFCPGNVCCATACDATACDSCDGGTCTPFVDPLEDGPECDPSVDLGSDPNPASRVAFLQSVSDGDDWYHFFGTDLSNSCTGRITIDLSVPPSADYDVELYRWNGDCSTLTFLMAGFNGVGQAEHVVWNENCGIDDTGYYLVRVVRYAGSSCSESYTLTVRSVL